MRFVSCLLALVLTATVVGPVPAAASAIGWVPCPEVADGVECGTLSVPVDWTRPRSPRIDVALARLPAGDPSARIGSLVVNPGGPGGSGVDFVSFIATESFLSKEITRRFDVVGFDPRGVGRSHPVTCSADLLGKRPFPFPASQAEFDAMVAYNRRLRADCRARTGPLFDHTDTLSVVHDLDAIRAALGDARLTFAGGSYGTIMGQQYAERYPHRVRALVLDSVLDHSVDTRTYLDNRAVALQDAFDEFVAWNERTPDSPLHGRDVRAFWHDLLARSQRPAEVINHAKEAFYQPDWAGLAHYLSTLDSGPATVATGSAPAPVGLFCGDFSLPVRTWAEFEEHVRRTTAFAPDVRWGHSTNLTDCLGYPSRIPNPQHRLRVAGSPPVLLVNARHDPAAWYGWAVSVTEQLGEGAVLLTYEGAGHGVFVDDIVNRFLLSVTQPERGASCPAETE
jgi:pimeloyl-ACP methyl ester carboxylesterase